MYLSNKQKTIHKEICFKGIGLHSGEYSNVILKPASEDTGILFIRRNGDLVHSIPADFNFSKSNSAGRPISSANLDIRISGIGWFIVFKNWFSGLHNNFTS